MGASGAVGEYEIDKSLRMNTNDSSHLTRTFDEAGNTKTFTLSSWFKFTKAGNQDFLWMTGGDGNNKFALVREGVTQINFECHHSSSQVARFYTSNMLRDFSNWYHFVLAIDTTQSTESDRMKFYINGVEPTMGGQSVSTDYPSLNLDFLWGTNSAAHFIGKRSYAVNANDWSDMYVAESYYIDGTACAATAFGETHADTSQWVPKKFAGSYGNAGYYIKFADDSNNTAATLGKDSSGNSNNWTPTNHSVSGTATDSFSDTPTNNFPILNWNQTGSVTDDRLHDGSLSIDWQDSHNNKSTVVTHGMHSGKWYFEVTNRTDASGQGALNLGMFPDSYITAKITSTDSTWPGGYSGSGIGFNGSDQWYLNGSNQGTYGGTWAENDIIGFAVDVDAGKIAVSKNGQWADGSGNYDEANVNAQKDLQGTGPYFFAIGDSSGSDDPKATINFGQRAFSHTIPTGYKKFCSQNMPEPTIPKPTDHVNTVLYTGNATSRNIVSGFSTDMVWIKRRSGDETQVIANRVIGADAFMSPDHTNDENTASNCVTAFNSDGVTVGTQGIVNDNTETFFSCHWNESATAGFDIVSYTGNGSAGNTFSHSLGVAPDLVIIKNRDTDGPHWFCYMRSMGNTTWIPLDAASTANTGVTDTLNSTSPTSSVVTLGNNNKVNANGTNYIAYLWTAVNGYSKFWYYTGNGNADGPFVYTGFEPAIMIAKNTATENSWRMWNNKVQPYNPVSYGTYPDTSDPEDTAANWTVDWLSNGFKVRNDDGEMNGDGQDIIYWAWAKSPFKYSNAR